MAKSKIISAVEEAFHDLRKADLVNETTEPRFRTDASRLKKAAARNAELLENMDEEGLGDFGEGNEE